MNYLLLFAAVFAIFIAVDFLSAKLLSVKRTRLRNVSLAVLCVAVILCGVGGVRGIIRNADTDTRTLYNAYSYLVEGNYEKAAENAEKVQSPHADMILLLADCWRGNYASVFINSDDLINEGGLNDELARQAERIYGLSRQMTGLEGVPMSDEEVRRELSGIGEDCFALLKVSEDKEVEFLAGFQRDRMLSSDNYYEVDQQMLAQMLLETPEDEELLRYSVKYYNAVNDLNTAEKNAYKLLMADKSVEHLVLYTDIIAQKLLDEREILVYDESDREIASLLDKAESAKKAAEKYEEDNPRRKENLAREENYRRQAEGVKAKRIINWLIAQSPLFGDRDGVIDLQLSRLYSAAGDDGKAQEILLDLVKRKDRLNEDSQIRAALEDLSRVYFDESASDDDIAAAIDAILRTDAFLPDSVLSRGYSEFLNNMLKYERVTIFISRVDADDYPVVRAYLNVNGKKDGLEELANDFTVSDFTFADSGFNIANKKVMRITDDTNNLISIALVIDGSGSMSGERIENARRAVEACIDNMDPDTQELSIVMYDEATEELCPLTNDAAQLRTGAKRIDADGGTNIPAGLLGGIHSLRDAVGSKAIILMTDGEDGNAAQMPAAIEAAKEENIAVFTVSTGGGDRQYMENIAVSTGGTYMEALTSTDLVKVYTVLQNYIVNNYCFEYTVEENMELNPRILTIGLADYETDSSRTYSYGGLILAKDGSYIARRTESGDLRLLYAEPAVVSATDVKLGVPIFISASGITEGAEVLVNNKEVKNVRTVGDSAVTFILSGEYAPGALDVAVRLPDGTCKSTNRLLSVAAPADRSPGGQLIILGQGGNTLYADKVERKDDYTLELSGNVVLNGFVSTPSSVTVWSGSPVPSGEGNLVLSQGVIQGRDGAYVDFTVPEDAGSNYGQMAFGGGSVKVQDMFSFRFDEYSVETYDSWTTLTLPGFGEVYGNAQFDGSEFRYVINDGYELADLQDNLNFAFNGIALPQSGAGDAMQTITGYSSQVWWNNNYSGYGFDVRTDGLHVTIGKDYVDIDGNAVVAGNLGLLEITGGTLTVDTANTEEMFEISGKVNFNRFHPILAEKEQTPFSIRAKGWYPDSLTIHATGFAVDANGVSECFTEGKPQALNGALTVKYGLSISDEPYRSQVSGLLTDILLTCDTIEFVCTDDWSRNGFIAYASENPEEYVRFAGSDLIIPINDVDELSVFGSDIGGEITGEALINDRQIVLYLSVDGHLDNFYYDIRHDGKADITVWLPRGAYTGSSASVEVKCDGVTWTYNAAMTGGILPEGGFHTYAEDYGE